jgi:hypothetical protein
MFAPRGWLKGSGARRIYRTIEPSPLFDAPWYRARYLAKKPFVDPLWHYLDAGWQKGHDPSPLFDTSHYLETSRDVRQSHLNPLFHYLAYGREERRSPLRSARETFHHYFPQAAPLAFFDTPSTAQKRLTAVLDDATESDGVLDLVDTMSLALHFAQEHSRTLRIISRRKDFEEVCQALRTAQEKVSFSSVDIDIVNAIDTDVGPTIALFRDEIFLATSWTSAYVLRHAAPAQRLFAMSYSSSTPPSVISLSVEEAANEAWESEKDLDPLRKDAVSPAFEEASLERGSVGKIAILWDLKHPFAYCQALQVLEDCVLRNPAALGVLEFHALGEGMEPAHIAEQPIERHPSPRHASLFGEYDLVLNASGFALEAEAIIDCHSPDRGRHDRVSQALASLVSKVSVIS